MKLTGKTYYIDPSKLGDINDGIKQRRPLYVLKGINNDFIFAVLSTTKKHVGKKKTYQHKKYIEWKKGSYLRVDKLHGWTTIKKDDLKLDKNNINEMIKLTKKEVNELIIFYNDVINSERNRLRDINN